MGKNLSYISYHWLWGLRYNRSIRSKNLFNWVEKLDDNKVHELRKQQNQMNQRNSVVIFLFRLFNINQYASNSYILAAFEINKGLQRMDFSSTATWAHEVIFKLLDKINFYSGENEDENISKNCHSQQSSSTSTNRTRYSQSEHIYSDKSEQERTPKLIIDCSLKIQLQAIGLDREEGEWVIWQEIRDIFKTKAKLYHPDKCSNHSREEYIQKEELFINLRKNYNLIKDRFFPGNSVHHHQGSYYTVIQRLYKESQELERSLLEQQEKFKKLVATWDRTEGTRDRTEATRDRIMESNEEIMRDLAEIKDAIKPLIAMQSKDGVLSDDNSVRSLVY